jgi:hypothetical protein
MVFLLSDIAPASILDSLTLQTIPNSKNCPDNRRIKSLLDDVYQLRLFAARIQRNAANAVNKSMNDNVFIVLIDWIAIPAQLWR